MDESAFSALFCAVFAQNGLARFCTQPNIQSFYRLTALLLEANAKVNLTAIRELPDIVAKHYADCLLAEPYFPKGAHVLDIGCGGGFPTFPLAIVRHDLHITAMDSTQKKIYFVKYASDQLGLEHISPLCMRAEDGKHLFASFDIATSRAMAKMNVLCELAIPFAKIGGQIVALKGVRGAEELAEAEKAIRILGGGAPADDRMQLNTCEGTEMRHILTIPKIKQTPSSYPRSYAVILKKPL